MLSYLEMNKKIISILSNRLNKMDAVPIRDIIDDALEFGITESDTLAVLHSLDICGVTYRPRHGLIKMIKEMR
jgi:DNA replicative helicase MCM subunit Mcm2 (Cdc46/Mcm family)